MNLYLYINILFLLCVSADGNFTVKLMTKATIHYNGTVVWRPPAIYKSLCPINVKYFPFDEQSCMLKIGSWTYDGFSVDIQHKDLPPDAQSSLVLVERGIDLQDYYESTEWDLLEVPAKKFEKYYTCCSEPYPDIKFNITIRRKTLFYTVNLILPCVAICSVTLLVFYIPANSGEKITMGITILNSLNIFLLLVAEINPPTSLAAPLIGKYLLFTMVLVTCSIVVTVFVLNVHFRSPSTHVMPAWVRHVFLDKLPRVLMMRRPHNSRPSLPGYARVRTTGDTAAHLRADSRQMSESSLTSRAPFLADEYSDTTRRRHALPKSVHQAVVGVAFIADHLKQQDENDRVSTTHPHTHHVIISCLFTSCDEL